MKRFFLCWSILLMLAGCSGSPEDLPEAAPSIVSVTAARGEDYSEAVITCEVSSTVGLMEFGILWGEDEIVPPGGIVNRVFAARVSGLEFSKTYPYRAFIGNGHTRVYSETGTWATEDEVPPTPAILTVVTLLGSYAGQVRISGRIPAMDGVIQKTLLRCGVCYSADREDPTLEDFSQKAEEISPEGEFHLELKGLTPSATYRARPYATIGKAVAYGPSVTVKIPSTMAIVSTEGCEPFSTRVVMSGRVDPDWAPSLSAYGIDWDGHLIPAAGMNADGTFLVERSGLSPGKTYSYRAYANLEGMLYYGDDVSFTTPEIVVPETGYVDLGLSVCWGTKNLGADSPYQAGSKYAWGETTPKKTSFTWSNYLWCDGTSCVTKYNSPDQMVLLPEDDAATVALHDGWRIPTLEECQELKYMCRWVYDNEHRGYVVTSNKEGLEDHSIFISVGSSTGLDLWSSTVRTSFSFVEAWVLQVCEPISGMNSIEILSQPRCYTTHIRPVRDGK